MRVRETEPGGQLRQPGLHVGALAIPADQGVHGERVPEPVDSRPAALRAGPDPGPAEEDLEHLLRGLVVQAVAGRVDEQGRLTRYRRQLPAAAQVPAQRADRARVKQELTGRARLRI